MLEHALSPAHARRALVMGLKASALKVTADSITCLSLLMVTIQPWIIQSRVILSGYMQKDCLPQTAAKFLLCNSSLDL